MVPANYCNNVLGHYPVSCPPVYFKYFSQFHIICNSVCVRSTSLFCLTQSAVHFSPFDNVQRPKSSFINRTSSCPSNLILSPLVWTTDRNFLVGTYTSNPYSVTVFLAISLHSELRICVNGCCKIEFSLCMWFPQFYYLFKFGGFEWKLIWNRQASHFVESCRFISGRNL